MPAVSSALAVALTVNRPVASTVVSSRYAVAPAPVPAPNASEISGSPRIASTVLNRMFCDAQPMVLNASVALTDTPCEVDEFTTSASSVKVFSAFTVTSPCPVAVPVVVRLLSLA